MKMNVSDASDSCWLSKPDRRRLERLLDRRRTEVKYLITFLITSTHRMDRIFEALASSPRRQILAYLHDGELTAGEIGARFEFSKPALSSHLRCWKRPAW